MPFNVAHSSVKTYDIPTICKYIMNAQVGGKTNYVVQVDKWLKGEQSKELVG